MKTKIPLWEGNTLLHLLSGFGSFLQSLTLVNAHRGMSLPVRLIMEIFYLLWGCLCEWEADPGNHAEEQPVRRAGRNPVLPNSPGSILPGSLPRTGSRRQCTPGQVSPFLRGVCWNHLWEGPSQHWPVQGFMPLKPGTWLPPISVYSKV